MFSGCVPIYVLRLDELLEKSKLDNPAMKACPRAQAAGCCMQTRRKLSKNEIKERKETKTKQKNGASGTLRPRKSGSRESVCVCSRATAQQHQA